jgi:hypothetical protein
LRIWHKVGRDHTIPGIIRESNCYSSVACTNVEDCQGRRAVSENVMAKMRQKTHAFIESPECEHQLVAIVPLISRDPVFKLRVHRSNELTSEVTPGKMARHGAELIPRRFGHGGVNVEAFEQVVDHVTTDTGRNGNPPNDTLAKLQAASRASGDAARPLPRLKMYSAGVACNGRDAVENESAEALQRRAKISAA